MVSRLFADLYHLQGYQPRSSSPSTSISGAPASKKRKVASGSTKATVLASLAAGSTAEVGDDDEDDEYASGTLRGSKAKAGTGYEGNAIEDVSRVGFCHSPVALLPLLLPLAILNPLGNDVSDISPHLLIFFATALRSKSSSPRSIATRLETRNPPLPGPSLPSQPQEEGRWKDERLPRSSYDAGSCQKKVQRCQ